MQKKIIFTLLTSCMISNGFASATSSVEDIKTEINNSSTLSASNIYHSHHEKQFDEFAKGKIRIQWFSVFRSKAPDNTDLLFKQTEERWNASHQEFIKRAQVIPNLTHYPAALLSEKSIETNNSFGWIRGQTSHKSLQEAEDVLENFKSTVTTGISKLSDGDSLIAQYQMFLKNAPTIVEHENEVYIPQKSKIERFETHYWEYNYKNENESEK